MYLCIFVCINVYVYMYVCVCIQWIVQALDQGEMEGVLYGASDGSISNRRHDGCYKRWIIVVIIISRLWSRNYREVPPYI